MLAVLNDTVQAQDIRVALDLTKLDVEPGLSGRDTWDSDKTYTLRSTWRDTVAPRGFQLIVWPSK